jgi:hypothetical protein
MPSNNSRNSIPTQRMRTSKLQRGSPDTYAAQVSCRETQHTHRHSNPRVPRRRLRCGRRQKVVFTLVGSPISWQAKKQTTVAQSTVEAEYAAMAQDAKDLIWLQNLLKDLGMSKHEPTILLCDNQGATPSHLARTRPIKQRRSTSMYRSTSSETTGTLNVECCLTEDMLADVMTKRLARDSHLRLLDMMGVRPCDASTTPSSSGMESTSGSVELLRRCHARNNEMEASALSVWHLAIVLMIMSKHKPLSS